MSDWPRIGGEWIDSTVDAAAVLGPNLPRESTLDDPFGGTLQFMENAGAGLTRAPEGPARKPLPEVLGQGFMAAQASAGDAVIDLMARGLAAYLQTPAGRDTLTNAPKVAEWIETNYGDQMRAWWDEYGGQISDSYEGWIAPFLDSPSAALGQGVDVASGAREGFDLANLDYERPLSAAAMDAGVHPLWAVASEFFVPDGIPGSTGSLALILGPALRKYMASGLPTESLDGLFSPGMVPEMRHGTQSPEVRIHGLDPAKSDVAGLHGPGSYVTTDMQFRQQKLVEDVAVALAAGDAPDVSRSFNAYASGMGGGFGGAHGPIHDFSEAFRLAAPGQEGVARANYDELLETRAYYREMADRVDDLRSGPSDPTRAQIEAALNEPFDWTDATSAIVTTDPVINNPLERRGDTLIASGYSGEGPLAMHATVAGGTPDVVTVYPTLRRPFVLDDYGGLEYGEIRIADVPTAPEDLAQIRSSLEALLGRVAVDEFDGRMARSMRDQKISQPTNSLVWSELEAASEAGIPRDNVDANLMWQNDLRSQVPELPELPRRLAKTPTPPGIAWANAVLRHAGFDGIIHTAGLTYGLQTAGVERGARTAIAFYGDDVVDTLPRAASAMIEATNEWVGVPQVYDLMADATPGDFDVLTRDTLRTMTDVGSMERQMRLGAIETELAGNPTNANELRIERSRLRKIDGFEEAFALNLSRAAPEELATVYRNTQERMNDLINNLQQGGFTFRATTGDMATTGNSVSPYPEWSARIDPETFDRNPALQIRNYLMANSAALAQPGHHMGAWAELDKDTQELVNVWLDVVAVFPQENVGRRVGELGNQKAMFNLDRMEEIPLGGTGESPLYSTDADAWNRLQEVVKLLGGNP